MGRYGGYGKNRDAFDVTESHYRYLVHPQFSRDPRTGVQVVTQSTTIPTSYDLTTIIKQPSIWNQGQLGSCTSFASLRAYVAMAMALKLSNDTEQSELGLYYDTRKLEGTTSTDSGATISDTMKTLATVGTAPEDKWPYVVANFATAPPASYYASATPHKITRQSIPISITQFKAAITANEMIVVGIECFEEIESDHAAQTGFVNMPANPRASIGGHAIALVAFDDNLVDPTTGTKGWIKFANSWGESWGASLSTSPSGTKGYGMLPYAYIRYFSDAWRIAVET